MAAPNFELITELQTCTRRDFPLSTAALLNPLNANPVLDGEWLELDANLYTLKRGSTTGTPAVFPVHTERGRYDTQAIGKVNVIFLGMYEAETAIHNGASDSLSGYVAGDSLCVNDVTVGSLTRRGLVKDSTTDGRVVVGYVTKLIGSGTTGRVRFIHFGTQHFYAI